MHILVTGGCGFIGSHVVEYHLKKNDTVHVIDNLTTGSLKNVEQFQSNPNFHVEIADILDYPKLDEMLSRADRVYHLAAVLGIYRVIEKPLDVLNTNILGTERILRLIAKSGKKPRIMMASSSSAYGNCPQPFLREDNNLTIASPSHPLWGYAISKIADEAYAIAYYRTYQLPITMMRFFNTVGPRQTGRYGMVVPRFVQQACRGEPLTVHGDGTQTRSFCDVRDTVVALDLLADAEKSIGEVVNVGLDSDICIEDLALLVKKLANSQSEIIHVPYEKAYGQHYTDIQQRRPDISKMLKLIQFKHQWNLERTVTDLIASFRSQKTDT